jgi:hypothetical protein
LNYTTGKEIRGHGVVSIRVTATGLSERGLPVGFSDLAFARTVGSNRQ